MKHILVATGLLLCRSSVFAAEKAVPATLQKDALITINGMENSLRGHLDHAIFFDYYHLRLVDFVRYTPEKGYVIFAQGNPSLTEHELDDIKSGNYAFLPFYKLEKRGTAMYEGVAAVLFGTTDEKVVEGLRLIHRRPRAKPAHS